MKKRSNIVILIGMAFVGMAFAALPFQSQAASTVVRSVSEKAIDDGNMFVAQIASPSIAAAGTYLVGLSTGSRPVKILDRFYDIAFDNCTIELFENTYTGGTPITTVGPRNFVIGGAPPLSFVAAPTGTPTTLIASIFLRNAAGAMGTIGVQGEGLQYILKPNTQYLLRVTNSGSGSGIARLTYNFRNMLATE